MDYQNFKKEYMDSGVSQKRFSIQKGISPSMVSYYLKRAREEVGEHNSRASKTQMFEKVEIKKAVSNCIKIKLPKGIEIEIPI